MLFTLEKLTCKKSKVVDNYSVVFQSPKQHSLCADLQGSA